ncbi:class II aldolase/adducin family protein [Tabrizicola fusiformis]|uniref:class II aldolase/adducin family protein n=1 Tax=Tabrizicola sp. SY72 TaxID=2741673 RepID=UPI0015722BE8|nr:class II aldolase/adducin family protein [Tabrizicola sp. SY72]NTT87655.1 class II aldolase/adducin family protein [Tabrizicola sp. SY72]
MTDPREALIAAARRSVELGLNAGTVGNFSLRHGQGMLLTPTGIAPAEMVPDQIVEMDLQGGWAGAWRPSSEWAIHARIYQTTTAGAVVHCHPDHCVALSALQRPIPPFHYMVAGFGGGSIPCARYACFGSTDLAEAVVEALGQTYSACLMASHGAVTLGPDLATALMRAEKLETLARQYLLARLAGEPVLLTPAELAEVHSRYATYGQQAKS